MSKEIKDKKKKTDTALDGGLNNEIKRQRSRKND